VLKANKYRLYPSDNQKESRDRHFGCGRFVFNPALETKTWAYSAPKTSLSGYDLQVELKDLKEDCPWLWEVNSQSLQCALLNLDMAVRQLFQRTCGKFPDFKKRSGKQSFLCPQNITIENGWLSVPKFKKGINIVLHREIKGIIKWATLSKTPAGKYFVSILTETKEVIPAKNIIDTKTTVGIDLGIKTFAVPSDGTEFENQKYLKQSLERPRILQRRVSGKVTGGSNRKKSVKRLATLPEKITNQRKDFLHKVTDAITRQYDRVCVEDLAVSNMIKNHKLSQSISDAGWGMFGIFKKYKADWHRTSILAIGKFEPGAKLYNS
jgi:putative transposase